MANLSELPKDASRLISSTPADCHGKLVDLYNKYNFGDAEVDGFLTNLDKGSLTAEILPKFAAFLEKEKQGKAPKKQQTSVRNIRGVDNLKRRLGQAVGLSDSSTAALASAASPATAGAFRASSTADDSATQQVKRAREGEATGPVEQTLPVSLKTSINAGKLGKPTTSRTTSFKLLGDEKLWTGDSNGAYTWMDEAVADRAARREERLQEREPRIAAALEARHSQDGATLGTVGVPSQAETFICGRILCEGLEGRLNERSILLEGSHASGSISRVQLNVAECPKVAAFPGQIVGVLGRSGMTGATFHAREFLAGLPSVPEAVAPDRSLHCMVAAGPFCLHAKEEDVGPRSLDYAPLESVLAHAAKERPGTLILLGPFLDGNNDKVKGGETSIPGEKEPCSFEEVYSKQIIPLLARGLAPLRQNGTEVLILPSLDEVLCFHPMPQPPLDVLLGGQAPLLATAVERLKRLGVRFLPNPAHVDINGIKVSLTSADALSPLLKEIVLRPGGQKIEEALRLLLLQQGLFPMVPRDPPQVSEARAAALDFPGGVRPQLVIFPSIMGNATGLFVDDTIFVNPGPLCKPKQLCSFAEVWIAPSTGAVRLQDRVRVDIHKLGRRDA